MLRVSYDDLTFLEQSKCWHENSPQRIALEWKAILAGEIPIRWIPQMLVRQVIRRVAR